MADLIAALDQGTTSTRFMVFDHEGHEVARHQLAHEQLLPRAGWIEHNPLEIWDRLQTVAGTALASAGLTAEDLAGVGLTNQRETTLAWERRTGMPVHNAIVWQDTRAAAVIDRLDEASRELVTARSGLVPAPYFAGGKMAWLLEHVDGLRKRAATGEVLLGTMDSWLLWGLTGGPRGGRHITDVTNASRTMLTDLATGDWCDELLALFGVPRQALPEVVPSAVAGGYARAEAPGPLSGALLAAALGDQQAATVGQACFQPGQAKNTYGTGNFMLFATGTEIVRSSHGLLTTPAYAFDLAGQVETAYALEGSIAVTGSAVQWLRDQLGIISGAAEIEPLARQVEDTGGMYFVPAFSGLYAPHWRGDARGAIVGLSRYNTNAHLARATLEAICYQTRDVVDAMAADSGVRLDLLRVDGGVTANDLCMQLQADILGVPVSRPRVAETTCLGAACAAGLATGFWAGTDELAATWREGRRWEPTWSQDRRDSGHAGWLKAVQRSLDWA